MEHVYTTAFAVAKANAAAMPAFGRGEAAAIRAVTAMPVAEQWFQLMPPSFIGAFEHLAGMVNSVVTVFNEMVLEPAERAGPPLASAAREARRRGLGNDSNVPPVSHSVPGAYPPVQPAAPARAEAGAAAGASNRLLATVLNRFFADGAVSVRNMNACCNRLRGAHDSIRCFFDDMENRGLGQREGEPRNSSNPLRFVFTAERVPRATANDLGRLLDPAIPAEAAFLAGAMPRQHECTWHGAPRGAWIDLGESFRGTPCSCFALHLCASAFATPGLCPGIAKVVVSQAESLAQGHKLDVTPQRRRGALVEEQSECPDTLLSLHKALAACRVALPIVYAESFQAWAHGGKVVTITLGCARARARLMPLLVSACDQHCVLMTSRNSRADSVLAMRFLVGGDGSEAGRAPVPRKPSAARSPHRSPS